MNAQPSAELETRLALASSQLTLYARDLKRLVDEEKRKTWELSEANDRLEVLDKLKNNFLGLIAHELKTPLTQMSAIECYDPDGDKDEQAELIRLVQEGHKRLSSFVDRVIEYFDWASNGRRGCETLVDLVKVARDVSGAAGMLQKPDVEFRLNCVALRCPVRAEEEPLKRVVGTLLDNAYQFSSKERQIRLEVKRVGKDAVLEVEDRGQGFDSDLAHELFRPFTVSCRKTRSEGTGLNLALASAIVEAYGGRMTASSGGPQKGALFQITFPASGQDDGLDPAVNHPAVNK